MLLNNKANFQETLKQMIIDEKKAKDIELKNKMAKITEQMFKTTTSETTQETNKIEYIKITKEELDQLKTELAETKKELEETKKELEETKEKLEEQHIIVNDITEHYKEEINKLETLLLEKDYETNKLNNELKEYRPRSDFIELSIKGFSVNDMYSYCTPFKNKRGELQDRTTTDDYKDWQSTFEKELDRIGIDNLKKSLKLDTINFNKPLQLNVTYGLYHCADLDNVQKAFQDRLFDYLKKHGYKSDDKLVYKLVLDKKQIYNEHCKSIKFSLFNI